jgi:outer membrane protein
MPFKQAGIGFMTRTQTFALSVGALLLLAAGSAVQAQSDLKIGYINLNAIIQNAPQIPALNNRLRDEFASRDSAFQAMQEGYQEKVETFQRDSEVMSQAESQALQRELTQMQRDLERTAADLQEDLQVRQNELVGELQLEIVEKVQAWAELNDYDVILTEVVYVSEAVDISAQVYDAIASSVDGAPAEADTDDE